MRIDGALDSLVQGVSQQPARDRLSGQCTLQENYSSNPQDGLIRRAAIEHILKILNTTETPQFYDYTVDGTRYIVVALNGDLRVFDLAGAEYTVTEVGTAFNYLDTANLEFTTLEDPISGTITYVANTDKVSAMSTATKTYIDTGSLVFLLGGQYGRTYGITIRYSDTSTIAVTWTAPDGSAAAHTAQVTTDYIATQLETALNADGIFAASFTVTRVEDVLHIKKNDDAAIEVTIYDGDGGLNMYVVNNFAPDTSKLPRYAPQNYIVRVQSSETAEASDLYLEFVIPAAAGGSAPVSGAGFGKEGTWVESVANDTEYLMDTATMPHVLTLSGSTFSFSEGAWLGRQVGDTISNEDPSFIGNTINYLSNFQGRLVMLSGTNVIMSRTNEAVDFFRRSVSTTIASDPIDISSTAKNVSMLRTAVPHNRDLVVWSDNAQFVVFGRNAITRDNSSLVLTTTFESELAAAPVATGRNIFFAYNYGSFTGMQEFFTDSAQDINDARTITGHVRNYMPGKIEYMATSSNFNTLVAHTAASTKDLFIYEYLWDGGKKVQSSWSKYIIPNDILYYFFDESVIYLVTKLGNDVILEKMDLNIQDDTGVSYRIHLDRKVTIAGVNLTITDPIDPMPVDPTDLIFVEGNGCPNPGLQVLVESYDVGTNTYTLERDMGGGSVVIGIRFTSKYKPTIPSVKDSSGVKIGTGKLIIKKFLVNYEDSGSMTSTVTSQYADDEVVEYSGRYVSNPLTLVGIPVSQSGTYTVPFRQNGDYAELELSTDDITPLNILDIEWVGQYNKRGKRIATYKEGR